MTIKNKPAAKGAGSSRRQKAPPLSITRLGIVSRDYRKKYPNSYCDFSYSLPDVLRMLDDSACDAVLFSLYSIIPRQGYSLRRVFGSLKKIKAVFLEEFWYEDTEREAGQYFVHHCLDRRWEEYCFYQVFGTLTGMKTSEINSFVKDELLKRIMGNCCVLLCGETNGVKYSPKEKKVNDTFGLRANITDSANLILNPGHDRMSRFEMKLKRSFLSENGRWVVSVWNKGKQFGKNCTTRDGDKPAWTVFNNGKEIVVPPVDNPFGVELAILEVIP